MKPLLGNLEIQTTNGEGMPVNLVGDIPLSSHLANVFHTPCFTFSLISVGQLVDDNCKILFFKTSCIVEDQEIGKMIEWGLKYESLYVEGCFLKACIPIPRINLYFPYFVYVSLGKI